MHTSAQMHRSMHIYVKNTHTCTHNHTPPAVTPSKTLIAPSGWCRGRDRRCCRGPGYLSHLSPIYPTLSSSPTHAPLSLLWGLQRHPCHSTNPVAPLLLLFFFFFLNAFQSSLTSPQCTTLPLLPASHKVTKHRGGEKTK